MRTNMSNFDAAVRITLGLALLSIGILGIVEGMMPRIAIMLVALVPLFTGMTGYCPLYHLLHIHTDRI